jgi:hypothetical protein
VTDELTAQPPSDREDLPHQGDGAAPAESQDDAGGGGEVNQVPPELSDDQAAGGERRSLMTEDILNQPEVPIVVPGAGTSIRPFIRHNESADVFGDALDVGLTDRDFAVRTLARLTTNAELTPDQVAAWPDEQLVAAICLLLASDEYLAPPEGKEVTIESFREAGGRVATENQRRWGELAKRATALYPRAYLAKQIAELNVAEKFSKLARPDYEAISGLLTATSGVRDATRALREMSGAERTIAQANSINDTIRRIGTIDPDLLRVQNPIADTIQRIGEMNPAAETIRRAWVGNSVADIVGDALREREARIAQPTRDIYTPPAVLPVPPRSRRQPARPIEVDEEVQEDDADGRGSVPPTAAPADADPGAVIEATSITLLYDAVTDLKTEMSKNTSAVWDLHKGQGSSAFWTKIAGIFQVLGFPVAVAALVVALLAINKAPAAAPPPTSSASPALNSPASASATPAPPSPKPSPTARLTAAPSPLTSRPASNEATGAPTPVPAP